MDDKEYEHRLTDVESRCKSNTHRIGKLEESTEAINRLATSVEVMATKQDAMGVSVDKLVSKVDTMEAKPAKRWEGLVDKLLFAVAGAVLAWLAQGGPGL